jgi:hypothetical protein
MRAQPADVRLDRREWRVGGWSEGLYLNDERLSARQLFIDADFWGDWETGSMARTLRAAGWLADVRPYELRHSAGIALSNAASTWRTSPAFSGTRISGPRVRRTSRFDRVECSARRNSSRGESNTGRPDDTGTVPQ